MSEYYSRHATIARKSNTLVCTVETEARETRRGRTKHVRLGV